VATQLQHVSKLRIDFLTCESLASALPDSAWDELAVAAQEPNCFLERWFLMASITHLEVPESLRIACAWDDAGTLVGLLPLHISDRYGRLRLQHVRNWLHPNSFLGTPLVRTDYEENFWQSLLDALDDQPWASGLLCLSHLSEGPVQAALAATAQKRGSPCETISSSARALLEAGLAPDEYYGTTVRSKKRKEIRRLQARLAEIGDISTDRLTDARGADAWIEDFMVLERAGWKGEAGSALGSSNDTRQFFNALIHNGLTAGRIEMLRLSVGGTPIAMLINFMALPGSFQFKIAYDESYARFSPGVLIELENYAILARDGFGWMDSCAAEDHPMIDSLWSARRQMLWVVLPLGGFKRRMAFRAVRLAEAGWAMLKRLRKPANDNRVPDTE
jgi:CelD/BcsL family acetyltransferase involved in cellulose biosynthesis